MLRKLSNFALLMGAILLTGCLKNDNDGKKGQEYVVTEGAFIVDAGNPSNGIDGSLNGVEGCFDGILYDAICGNTIIVTRALLNSGNHLHGHFRHHQKDNESEHNQYRFSFHGCKITNNSAIFAID